jgi:amino acid transporter
MTPDFRSDVGRSAIAAFGVLLGVLVGEASRTRWWTIQTPHSREALLDISILFAAACAIVAFLGAAASLTVKRATRRPSRLGLTNTFILMVVVGVPVAFLGRLGNAATTGALALLLLGPVAVVWSSPRSKVPLGATTPPTRGAP